MAKPASSCPACSSSSRMRRLTSDSTRPASGSAMIASMARSAADAAARSRSISSALFTRRSSLIAGARGDQLGRVERGPEAKREARPHLVLHGDAQRAADQRADQLDRILGLVPRQDLDGLVEPVERVPRQRLLEARQNQRRLAVGRARRGR